MKDKSKKTKREIEIEQAFADITSDLQRTRADFENFRKRSDNEKEQAKESGKIGAILNLLPVIDNIDRAIRYAPDDIKDHKWVKGVMSLTKNMDNSLKNMNIARIVATPGTPFNPEFHDAIFIDEESVGDNEVIAEEMQAGYTMNNVPIRHAMVRVTRQ